MINQLFILLAANPGQAQGGNQWSQVVMLLAIVAVFYFLMIRPNMKRQKEAKEFRKGLKAGDKVITVGGIYGKIAEVSENTVLLDVGNNMKLKIDKNGLVKDPSEITQEK